MIAFSTIRIVHFEEKLRLTNNPTLHVFETIEGLTEIDRIITVWLQALSNKLGEAVEGLEEFDFEAYFRQTVQKYLADKTARLVYCQGLLSPIYLNKEYLESFLTEDGLARFEELVKKVQGSDAYLASVKFYPDAQGKVHGIYHLAQGVKTILPKEPFVPASYTEQLAGKELVWEIDIVTISGDGSKAEAYEAIARLDYARFLESLPEAFYQQLDANQLEVQAILGKDFEGLATIK